MSAYEDRASRRRSPRRLFWPVVLIAIGFVFLLDNLGLLPGDAGETLLRLWPLILILIGVDGLLDREGIAGATFMIGLGAALLLGTLGYLALDAWQVILTVWPVMVIAWGVDLMIGRRFWLLSLAGALAVLAILAVTIGMLSGQIILPGGGARIVESRQDFSAAQSAQLNFELPVGVMKISAAESGAELIAAVPSNAEKASEEFSLHSGTAVYTWKAMQREGTVFSFAGNGPVWEFHLPPALPLTIQIDQGVSVSTFNLGGVILQKLDAEFGVGRMRVVLPAEAAAVKLSGGVGFITVAVPDEVGVSIRRDTGLAYFLSPDGYTRTGDVYQSPGYENANVKIDLDVELGVGGIQLVEADPERQ